MVKIPMIIMMSLVKTIDKKIFSHTDIASPEDLYAKSKLEAEKSIVGNFFKNRFGGGCCALTISLWLWCKRKFSKVDKTCKIRNSIYH